MEQTFHEKRQTAMDWWNSMSEAKRQEIVDDYFTDYKRHFYSLTGREIQNIYEHRNINNQASDT